jgi:dTDP-glucose 4,6-dehydratase
MLMDEDRFEILGISRSPEKPAPLLAYAGRSRDHFRYVQLNLNKQTDEILERLDAFEPELMINFAAQSEAAASWTHPEDWFETNTVAFARLLDGLKDRKHLKRYLHVSSPEVYGSCEGNVTENYAPNPSTPYAASKAAADLLLQAYVKSFDFPGMYVRATNIYGAFQQLFRIIPKAFVLLKKSQIVDLHGGGRAVKSYIHIRDVSRAELAILENGRVGEIYNISPDRGYEVREMVQMVCDALGKDFAASTRTVADRIGQDAKYTIDSSKARRELGWTPRIEIREGIEGVGAWIEREWATISRAPLEYEHQRS